jgi:hypothetical protein
MPGRLGSSNEGAVEAEQRGRRLGGRGAKDRRTSRVDRWGRSQQPWDDGLREAVDRAGGQFFKLGRGSEVRPGAVRAVRALGVWVSVRFVRVGRLGSPVVAAGMTGKPRRLGPPHVRPRGCGRSRCGTGAAHAGCQDDAGGQEGDRLPECLRHARLMLRAVERRVKANRRGTIRRRFAAGGCAPRASRGLDTADLFTNCGGANVSAAGGRRLRCRVCLDLPPRFIYPSLGRSMCCLRTGRRYPTPPRIYHRTERPYPHPAPEVSAIEWPPYCLASL